MEDASLNGILEYVSVGTEMFVRVARLAFYWKNKFDEMYPRVDLNELIAGAFKPIGNQLQTDLVACRNGSITREELVRRYGHLRPGQFSVFSESYADDPETYLFAHMSSATNPMKTHRHNAFEGTIEFKNVIMFMQARERMKFLFTQVLYLFSVKLKRVLAERGISEKDASRLSWRILDSFLSGPCETEMSSGEEFPVLLPDVIVPGVTDLKVVTFAEAMPSYITSTIVKACVCVLEQPNAKVDVQGALVLLPNSDPGYDFLFHSGAVGIITKVGGPASHMCIRALELQMPSCIGCGENMYQTLASAKTVVLDCKSRQIIVLD
ncbi:MAG: PEP-utilizing enzyme [Patescibacteria group bacterium]